jgi:PKD repeat protein
MKKFLLSMIAIFAMTICGFAQMPVCADACAPHANDADYSTGVIPTYPTAFAPLTVGVPVDECISIKIPSQISGSAINSALGFVNITVNSVNVNGLVGLPEGLEACASANPMAANGTYTLRITGTPTTAGDYPLNMRAEIDGQPNIALISMSTVNGYTNSESGVSTNITITVVEAGGLAANFSTNPSATGMFSQAVHITEGETVAFSDLSTGADHIAWTFEGGNPATSTDANVTVTYATAGTYTATLTAYNEDESVSDSKSVSIEVSEFVISASFTTDPAATGFLTQSVTIEQGQTVAYTNTSTNAHHIAWSFPGGDPATSTTDNVTVTYNTVGTFTTELIAYNEGETDSDTATLTITVNASAENAVTADFTTNPEATDLGGYASYISINQYETITFTNASSENTHHIAWTFEGGSPATSTENTVEVTYNETPSGLYFTATLTAYNEDETISNSKSVYIRVASVDPDAVEANFTTDPEYTDWYITRMLDIEVGTTVTYTSTCNANTDHIAWTFEGGNPGTSTENTVAVTYATAGSYTTTLVAYNSDETRTDTITLSVTVTDESAVDENAISEISVYPNPTSSVINIAAEGMQNITIIDMTGRVVMSKDVNSDFETIDAEGFAKANYMVRIATADGVVVKNIVVE